MALEVVNVSSDVTTCHRCSRTGLKRCVQLSDGNWYGSDCAALLMYGTKSKQGTVNKQADNIAYYQRIIDKYSNRTSLDAHQKRVLESAEAYMQRVKKSNSFLDDLFGKRSYSAKSGEWTSASHAKHGIPGFEKRSGKRSSTTTYQGKRLWKQDGIWKTSLDPETDFDSEKDVKAFIRANPSYTKSKGHLLFVKNTEGTWEFFKSGNDVYRVQLAYASGTDASTYLDTSTGFRSSARYFAPMWQWEQFKEKGMYPFDKESKKANPSTAEEMSEAFHGRAPLETVDLVETEDYIKDQAIIGLLEELEVTDDGKTAVCINFKHHDHRSAFAKQGKEKDTVYVTTDAAGRQISFVGGDQKLPIEDSDKMLVDVGEVYSITYYTDKHHLSDGKGFSSYIHKFGEEGGTRPILAYDTMNKRMLLMGGSYVVEAEGIKN